MTLNVSSALDIRENHCVVVHQHGACERAVREGLDGSLQKSLCRLRDSMADKIGDHRIRYAYPKRIDYVFVGTPGADGAGHVLSCEVVGDDRFGTWPSDHLAVFARVRAPAPAPDDAAKL